MREYTVGRDDAGQRLDRFLTKLRLPSALVQKSIRTRKVRVNGKHRPADTRLQEGDVLAVYVSDVLFQPASDQQNAYRQVTSPRLNLVYENEHVLLLDKPAGQSVHPDAHGAVNTLIVHAQAYLFQSGQWQPGHTFVPALCHRLDKNTGGLVLVAKTHEALAFLNEKIRAGEVEKRYLCLVEGVMTPRQGVLTHRLWKDARQNRVLERDVPGAKTAVCRYRTLEQWGEVSLVECELVTGRTHQIRVQMALSGHPLVGDGKYGKPAKGFRGQALYAYRIAFRFAEGLGLAGKEFRVDNARNILYSAWYTSRGNGG